MVCRIVGAIGNRSLVKVDCSCVLTSRIPVRTRFSRVSTIRAVLTKSRMRLNRNAKLMRATPKRNPSSFRMNRTGGVPIFYPMNRSKYFARRTKGCGAGFAGRRGARVVGSLRSGNLVCESRAVRRECNMY